MLRRSPRALLLWTGAIAVAVVTAVVVGTDLAALRRRAHDLGPEVAAAVATRDLPTGATVQGDDVGVRRVHRSQLPPGVLSAGAARGRVVTVPVLRDAFVADRNLAPRRRRGLDGVVPPGMRIVRIVVEDVGQLRAGAAVDVLATFDATGAVDPDGAAYADPTVVVARGALVVATDLATRKDATDAIGSGVALLVTENEALAVAYASAAGVISVALVPPEDARVPLPT
jgi:Flp pilus assembly protein CpaB